MPYHPEQHQLVRRSTMERIGRQTRERERARRGGDGVPDRPTAPRVVSAGVRLWAAIPANTGVAAGASLAMVTTKDSWSVTVKNKWDTAIQSRTTARKVRIEVDEYGDWIFSAWDC